MPKQPAVRIASLDQFRGYTVLGMFLVNFVGGFAATPEILKHHHTYLSYADTIMPQFLFAVGFAMRLTFLRRAETAGAREAYLRALRRIAGLAVLAIVVHGTRETFESWSKLTELGFWGAVYPSLKRHWFQTLMQIAVTSLWVLPVVGAGKTTRVAWTAASLAMHVGLSAWFNFAWVNTQPLGIDGGPLGFLTWTTPTIVGTLACDWVDRTSGRAAVGKMLAWGAVLMLVGYAASCGTRLYDVPAERVAELHGQTLAERPVVPKLDEIERRPWTGYVAEPPFVPPPSVELRKWNYWMMSQRSGTPSYLLFAAGFSLALYAAFAVVCDRLGRQLGVLRTFGSNALAGYLIHDLVGSAVGAFVPHDAPGWYVAAATLAFVVLTYAFVRYLEKSGIYLRL